MMADAARGGSFFNLHRHGFVRAAVCVPEVRVADPAFNTEHTIELLGHVAGQGAAIALFPELGLTAYSCEDLFHQEALLAGAEAGLARLLAASRGMAPLAVVGLPLRLDGLLYNCAAVVHRGEILGVCPKSYLPNYREFYERRQFAPGETAASGEIELCGRRVPFGTRLLFRARDEPRLTLYVELCEDLWAPIPPSSFAALAGATMLANLSASNATVAKDEYRAELVGNQSARCLAAYLYCAAGFGESTTDLAWDGHGMIYECGTRLAHTHRFAWQAQAAFADVDLGRIAQDRMRQTSFADAVRAHRDALGGFRVVEYAAALERDRPLPLEREVARYPFVPAEAGLLDQRCGEVYAIQVQGLVKRLHAMNARRVVIGVSGGIDSTQALLVCARAMDVMGLPRANILGFTMPGFATSARTLGQARELMAAVGCSAAEIDIRPSCLQMLRDLGHPFVSGEPVYDTAFENVQAGERTSHLFRLANLHGAPVVGTSDLSELALGWCTYGVGDHMAHYHVNASVPKTLVRFLVRHVAQGGEMGEDTGAVLMRVLETAASPELVPGDSPAEPGQRTEEAIGPFELHDFFLYHVLRFGVGPAKAAFLAHRAWSDRGRGAWPGVPESGRREYGIGEIRRWLEVFLRRFFGESQYKRSCIANAPKVGSGGSLSPRGDYRAPSDAEPTVWLAQLGDIPEEEPGLRP